MKTIKKYVTICVKYNTEAMTKRRLQLYTSMHDDDFIKIITDADVNRVNRVPRTIEEE